MKRWTDVSKPLDQGFGQAQTAESRRKISPEQWARYCEQRRPAPVSADDYAVNQQTLIPAVRATKDDPPFNPDGFDLVFR
jgi:hypothetical protein